MQLSWKSFLSSEDIGLHLYQSEEDEEGEIEIIISVLPYIRMSLAPTNMDR